MPRKKIDSELVVLETPKELAPTNGHNSLIPEQAQRIAEAMNGDIEPWAIQVRPGPGGKPLSYLPHGYIRDQLNKVFGPFWSELPVDISPGKKYDIVEYSIERENPRTHLKETKQVKEVVVMTELRIRIYGSDGSLISEETHPGSGGKIWENNIPFADVLQSAQSEALKRAAFPLGRKFGLQLYYDEVEKRAEWQEKFSPKPIEPPDNVAKLLTRMQSDNIPESYFFEATGYNVGDPDPTNPGKLLPRDRDVLEIWYKLEELINAGRNEG